MKPISFDTALDDCIARLKRGDTIEACLADYPEWEKELRPLLEMAAGIYALPVPRSRPLAVQDGRRRMLTALHTKPSWWQRLWISLAPARPALAFALVTILVVGLFITFSAPQEWLTSLERWLLPENLEPTANATSTPTTTPCCETPTITATFPPQPFFSLTVSPYQTVPPCFWEQCEGFAFPVDTRYPFQTLTPTRRPTRAPTVTATPTPTETAVPDPEEDPPTPRPLSSFTPLPPSPTLAPPTVEPTATPTPSPMPYPYPAPPTPTPGAYP